MKNEVEVNDEMFENMNMKSDTNSYVFTDAKAEAKAKAKAKKKAKRKAKRKAKAIARAARKTF